MVDYHRPVCKCGSLRFEFGLVMFPLTWMAVCMRCGDELVCDLKKTVKTPKKPPRDNYPDYENPDWWNGVG